MKSMNNISLRLLALGAALCISAETLAYFTQGSPRLTKQQIEQGQKDAAAFKAKAAAQKSAGAKKNMANSARRAKQNNNMANSSAAAGNNSDSESSDVGGGGFDMFGDD